MNKFKIGDRVAVYGFRETKEKIIGVITYVVGSYITVGFGDSDYAGGIHYKQCRLLKKKLKAPRGKVGGQVIWVSEGGLHYSRFQDGTSTAIWCSKTKNNMSNIKFIEAEDQSE